MSSVAIKRALSRTHRQINSRWLSASVPRQNIKNNILFNPYQIHIPRVSLPEYIFPKIEQYEKLTAFECPQTNQKYTFGDLRTYSRNFSKALRKKFGLKKQDVALIYLANCPQFPVAALGCLEAGVVASTANSLYTSDEIARQLKDSGAKLIITSCDLHENAVKAIANLPNKLPIICVKIKPDQLLPSGTVDYYEIINNAIDIPDLEPPNCDDIAILPYSSGTTGMPKGVRLSHYNIVSNLEQVLNPDTNFIANATGEYQEVSPGVLPMFHIYGFTVTTLALMVKGVRVITLPKFHPENYIDVLKNYPVSLIFAAPPLVLFLTHHPDVKVEYLNPLRRIMSGAAPLGALDEQQFLEKVGRDVDVLQGYGLTETSPVVTLTTNSVKKLGGAVKGSIGVPLPATEIKLVKIGDVSGQPLGPNEQGELLVRGPQVMQQGYHNNPKATEETFLDGWFKTGDLANYNENGVLFITDRVKELIKVRGFQVAPAELEELLRAHPHVQDVAVIGIPHPISGEVPRAYIKPKGNIDLEDVNKFIAEKVAKYKRLEGGIELVEEIPKNPSGKILRRQLKDKYIAENSA